MQHLVFMYPYFVRAIELTDPSSDHPINLVTLSHSQPHLAQQLISGPEVSLTASSAVTASNAPPNEAVAIHKPISTTRSVALIFTLSGAALVNVSTSN